MADGDWAHPGRAVYVRLDEPPRAVSLGVGVHGTTSPVDVFRLPDPWQLHLYRYAADLRVDGAPHAIRPGYVSLVPPGAEVRYRYRGRSEHLYAHLRLPGEGAAVGLPVVQDAGALTRSSPNCCSRPSRRPRAVHAGPTPRCGRRCGG